MESRSARSLPPPPALPDAMIALALSAMAFLGIHIGVSGTTLRDRVVRAVGLNGYMAGFSVASLAALIWLIASYKDAPYLETWGMLESWKPVMLVLMLPAFLLVVVGLTTPNPTSVAQEKLVAQAPRGIVQVTRHPFLMGVALWSGLHVVGNGDRASLLFFGAMLVVSVAGAWSIDAKRRRMLGADAWDVFARRTSMLPFAAILGGRARMDVAGIGPWRLGAGAGAYALMLGGHLHLVGVNPFWW